MRRHLFLIVAPEGWGVLSSLGFIHTPVQLLDVKNKRRQDRAPTQYRSGPEQRMADLRGQQMGRRWWSLEYTMEHTHSQPRTRAHRCSDFQAYSTMPMHICCKLVMYLKATLQETTA